MLQELSLLQVSILLQQILSSLWLLFFAVGQLIWDSLADNVIEELPASLSNLVQLKSFCLDNNQVKQGEQLKRDSRWIAERLQDSAKSLNRSEGGEIDEKLDGGGRT
ncbi:hypothetical protein N665_0172s0080 [Sinapis alba]|nr:hypothetical protein N665_0172s0080 [Sinapis alba]